MNSITLTFSEVCILILGIIALLTTVYGLAYKIGREVANENLQHHIDSAKLVGHSQGEKAGYEKGLTDGKSVARQELRDQFILFLEEQVRLLKNELPAPPQSQPEIEEGIFYIDGESERMGVLTS